MHVSIENNLKKRFHASTIQKVKMSRRCSRANRVVAASQRGLFT